MKQLEKCGPNRRRNLMLFFTTVAILAGGASLLLVLSEKESSPTAVRPWAAKQFDALVNPTASGGSPLDPQYQIQITRLDERSPLPLDEPTPPRRAPGEVPRLAKMEMDFAPPMSEFVREVPIHRFDSKNGFSAGNTGFRVKWFATQLVETQPRPAPRKQSVSFFDASGQKLSPGAALAEAEAGLQKQNARFAGREMDTSLFAALEVTGFKNPTWILREVFDAKTRVPLMRRGNLTVSEKEMVVEWTLTTLHGASLFAILDVMHGEEQIFEFPPEKGARIENPDFQLEVLKVTNSQIGFQHTISATGSLTHRFQWNADDDSQCFMIIHAGPNPVWETLSFEAVDVSGKIHPAELQMLKIQTRHPVRRLDFGISLSRIKSIQVRRKPLMDRLIMRVESLPGVHSGNQNPANLFDVQVPRMTFDDPSEMQYFIANTVQFKAINGVKGYHRPPGFPMTIENATPRNVLSHYLSQPGKRFAHFDKKQMTVEFDDNMSQTKIEKAWGMAKRILRIP